MTESYEVRWWCITTPDGNLIAGSAAEYRPDAIRKFCAMMGRERMDWEKMRLRDGYRCVPLTVTWEVAAPLGSESAGKE